MLEATDDDKVRHQLWVIDDPAAIEAVREAVAAAPVVVADGHHRYETARTYPPEALRRRRAPTLVMALVVELAAEQLEVGPIHRGLSGSPRRARPGRRLLLLVRRDPGRRLRRAHGSAPSGESESLALVMPSGAWLLSPQGRHARRRPGADLDSSMVALVIAELPDHELEFVNSWQDGGRGRSPSEQAQAVVLLRPVSVEQIAEWAHAGRRMPPKTTYFHPKPRTGMVFRPLSLPR